MSRGIVQFREAIEGTDCDLVVRFDETSILKRLGAKVEKNYSKKATEYGNTIVAHPNRVHISLSYYKSRILSVYPQFNKSIVAKIMIDDNLDDEGHYTIGQNPQKDFKIWIDHRQASKAA